MHIHMESSLYSYENQAMPRQLRAEDLTDKKNIRILFFEQISIFQYVFKITITATASYTTADRLYRFQSQDLLNEEHTESKDTDRTC